MLLGPNPKVAASFTIADDIHADPPIVVLKGGHEDGVVHVIVAGEGGSEPDGHLLQWYICVGVVGGGEEVSAVDGESLSLSPLNVGVPCTLYEPDILGFNLSPIVVGDVEPCRLSSVFLKIQRTHSNGGVVTAAAVAMAASTAPWGFIFFVTLELLEAIFCLSGSFLGVVCPAECVMKASMEELEGGGEIFGVVQEYLAIAGASGFEDHSGRTGREGVAEWGLDQLGDVIAVCVFINGPGLLVNSSFPQGNVTNILYVVSLLIIVDGDVGVGGFKGSVFCSHHSAGDGSDIFNVDESVGHCNLWLVEEVGKEAGVFMSKAARWGCHSVVWMLILLSVLAFINGCFL
jgi:hypothetical protein